MLGVGSFTSVFPARLPKDVNSIGRLAPQQAGFVSFDIEDPHFHEKIKKASMSTAYYSTFFPDALAGNYSY
jgi:hypothetical protein